MPAVLAQEAPVPAAAPAVVDPSRHTLGFVTVDGVKVPYLDWGGAGVALVFIPGMGNSAHVFDEFAPRFTDRFRVLGVTRVGYGESDQPQRDGYDLASRVAHVRLNPFVLNTMLMAPAESVPLGGLLGWFLSLTPAGRAVLGLVLRCHGRCLDD